MMNNSQHKKIVPNRNGNRKKKGSKELTRNDSLKNANDKGNIPNEKKTLKQKIATVLTLNGIAEKIEGLNAKNENKLDRGIDNPKQGNDKLSKKHEKEQAAGKKQDLETTGKMPDILEKRGKQGQEKGKELQDRKELPERKGKELQDKKELPEQKDKEQQKKDLKQVKDADVEKKAAKSLQLMKKDLKQSKEPPTEKKAPLSRDVIKVNGEGDGKEGKPKDAKAAQEETKKAPQTAKPKKPHLLKEGDVLLDKFRVEGLLADGGFAQVFAAIHEDTQTRWAVKIESEKCDRKRMKLEIMVLMLLRGKANIPEIMAMGTCPTGHFIILELVGRNLSDLRRQLPERKLSPGSLYRSSIQVTHALSLVHAAGFLHRDLKPSNFCVGADDVRRIYLIDYGLTRQYLDNSGQIRKARESIGMRGTLRYVSLEAHARHDLGPNHDLVALLYSIIELGDGSLPWSKMREENAIRDSKKETTVDKLCKNQPKMLKFAEYVLSMKYETMPEYDKITKMLESCHPPDVKPSDPYDWEVIPCQLEHFVQREEVEAEKPSLVE
ncbi:unnamed protein product [Cylicocyclus nassatus]|uniref:non-specific serine/threonine protein kinase n=1 Tax=Cylicocyclus nassatus TaxID=53992 RepID=A0AA36H174_CYLNA|nr:unnamed protein product [Cylicocyclus nassatus]